MLTAVSYGVVVVLAMSFFDGQTELEPRILTPLHMLLLMLVVSLVGPVVASMQRWKLLRATAAVGLIAVSGFGAISGAAWTRDRQPSSNEYASPRWQQSELLASVRQLPSSALIATNAPDLLYVGAGRSSISLPYAMNVHSGKVNEDSTSQLKELEAILEAKHGVVVWADVNRTYLANLDQLKATMPLSVVASGPDGTIFKVV